MFRLLGSLHVAPARDDGAAAAPSTPVILREVAGARRVAILPSLGIRPAWEKAAALD
jgi:hypothetical protein